MRALQCFYLFFLTFTLGVSAQVKIGSNPQNINPFSILELESNASALVITRMSTAQMNGIAPLQGALVYNTDEQCVFYYNGSLWENLCSDDNTTNISLELQESELILTDSDGNTVAVELGSAIDQTFSSDPIVGFRETIIITQTGDNYNFEVGEITGDNIVDSSINGIDLQDNSITDNKLAPNSVGQEELQDNAVSDLEIDYSQVTLSDFNNDAGFLTISPEPNNAIIDNNGAFYDDTIVQTGVATNAQGLADHIAADGDLDNQNELVLAGSVTGNTLTLNQAGGNPPVNIDITALNNSGTDEQNLNTDNTPGNISIDNGNAITLNVNDGDFDDQNEIQDADEVDINPITGITGGNVQLALEELQADVDNLNAGGGNTDEQNLSTNNAPGNISIDNGNTITLNVNDGDSDDQNELQDADEVTIDPITGIAGGNVQLALEELQTDVDNLVAGGGADGVVSIVQLTGTDLIFTGANGGFNNTVSLATLANTDAQNLSLAGNTLNISGGTGVDLTPILGGADTNDFVNDGTLNVESLELTGTGGAGAIVDLSPFALDTDIFTLPDDSGATNGDVLITDGAGVYSWATVAGGGTDTNNFITGGVLNVESLELTGNGGGAGAIINLQDFALDTDVSAAFAAAVDYDNTTSGLTATLVQDAIDELAVSATVDTDEQQLTLEPGNQLTLEDGGTPIDLTPFLDNTDEQDASEVDYDNTTSGLTATLVQDAIDEIAASATVDADEQQLTLEPGNQLTLEDGGTPIDLTPFLDNTDEQDASEVDYDNTTSGLTATLVQDAIDELAASGLVDTDEQQLTLEPGNQLTLEDGGTPIDLTPFLDNTDEQDASEIDYDNTTSGLTATLVQDAIDELAASATVDTDEQQLTLEPGNQLTLEDGGTPIDLTPFLDNTDEQDASEVDYDNTTSGLTATLVQDAIDELAASGLVDTDEQQLTLEPGNQLTLEDGGTPIDLTPFLDNTDEQDASEVDYDNTTSGLTATLVQDAIDELAASGLVNTDEQQLTLEPGNQLTLEDGGTPIDLTPFLDNTDEQDASEVDYDNTTSGLTATLVQDAIDELAASGLVDTDEQQLTLEPGNQLTLEDGGTPIDLTPFLDNTDEQDASEVDYDNTTSGLTATLVQDAIDELAASGLVDTDEQQLTLEPGNQLTLEDGGTPIDLTPFLDNTDEQDASEVDYDNTTSGLTATLVQDAIDELAASGLVDTDEQQLTLEPGNQLTLEDGGTPIDLTPFLDNTDEQDASEVDYDNTTSGLTATLVQDAIDELASNSNNNFAEANLVLDGNRTHDLNGNDLTISGTGNVGIGINPAEKLHVNGNVRADGSFLSTDNVIGVPDYVFQNYFDGYSELNEDYQFRSLKEIEAFIQKNKHLPGITSASQAQAQEYWNLSASNLQNLEKIEELFLHTIEQEKKIESLKEENAHLTNELDALKQDMALIKELLATKKEP